MKRFTAEMARSFWTQDDETMFVKNMEDIYGYIQDLLKRHGAPGANPAPAIFRIHWLKEAMIMRIVTQLREDGYTVTADAESIGDNPSLQLYGQTSEFLKGLHDVTFNINW